MVNPRNLRVAGLVGVALTLAIVAGACVGDAGRTPRIVFITLPPNPTSPAGSGGTPAPTAAPATFSELLVTSTAPDGRWTVTFKKPLVSGLPDTVGTKINDAITRQVNDYISAFTGQKLPAVAKDASPSQLQGDYAVAYNSSAVISLRFTAIAMVSGAESSVGTPGSLNFQTSTGKEIALSDLFADPTSATATIAAKTHSALASTLGTELTWDGKASSLDFFSGAWAIAADGLEFSWPQGKIASAAGGMPSAKVPWADLRSLLKPGSPVASLAG